MTAASAFCGPTAAYLLSDAAGFGDGGEVAAIRSKVIASSRLKVAAVMSGDNCIHVTDGPSADQCYSPANDLAQLLKMCRSQAEFLASVPDVVRDCFAVLAKCGSGYFQFVVALWNDVQHRAETYVIGSPGHLFPGLPPFTLAGANPAVSPPVDRSLWPSSGLTRSAAERIIREQRRTPWPDGTYRVGGFAELTTIDATGVRSETISRWPDRIGRKVKI